MRNACWEISASDSVGPRLSFRRLGRRAFPEPNSATLSNSVLHLGENGPFRLNGNVWDYGFESGHGHKLS